MGSEMCIRDSSITRSTVTNILQLMERKGYIERRSVPQDARLKQLVLTEEGICFHEKTMLCFHQTDDYVAGRRKIPSCCGF